METTKHMNTVENTTSNIDSLWNVVVNKDGCLTGGQYSKNGKFGNEGCVMDNSKEWKALFEVQKYNLSYYLLSRLDKTDTTIVHTCPFFMASEGELAVYTLQRLYNKNWYDFDEFSDYLARSNKKQEIPVSNRDNLQI
ncbi:hypothetical protein [Moheibacter sediminis]|uniref:Uncharacterized protein n=1 Tax=Moheibacter sediminis TaxID=1434700 RepID=A0A1W2A920_9FLAO|nr:hypothetical protein [Moheibacter sediminis]SMC57144.1 hypothetical protein SAMN06296427_10431 [Moheibacter sediminis]